MRSIHLLHLLAIIMLLTIGCSDPMPPVAQAGAGGGAAGAGAGGSTSGAGGSGADGAAGDSGAGGAGSGASGGSGGNGGSGGVAGSGPLTVVQVEPAARSVSAAVDAPIVIHFDRPVDRTTVTRRSLWAFGHWSGPVRDGAYTYTDGDQTVTLTPPRAFAAGDRITVVLSHDLKAATGESLRQEGYSFHFITAAKAASMTFTELHRLTIRSSTLQKTRAYGGTATDLDADGFLDLIIVNEDTADLRIFMNSGDGSGMYRAFEQSKIVAVGQRASPSDTTDFNDDGIIDVVVANLNANSLSIVFGNGDGTLTKSQDIDVAGEPRGVACIDIDGDGDIDVVNTNANGDNLSLLVNDGTGTFAALGDEAFFDAGHGMQVVRREFGLNAGDMDEDGILDLVIGAHGTAQMGSGVVINGGNGDGTFSFSSMQAEQTRGWQLAAGDLNGDGHEDVATADGTLGLDSPDSVTVLLGDGLGKASVKQTYTQNIANPYAIDLGDLDGDGDLDVVVSNYQGNWEILRNDGQGGLTHKQTVMAPAAASCSVLADIDNDGDLDMALIDEEDDVLVIMKQ